MNSFIRVIKQFLILCYEIIRYRINLFAKEYFIRIVNIGTLMAFDLDVLKKHLRETFGSDSQEKAGRKLNMTQGNVSKLLSGQQQPTIDTLYRIADEYGVSIDWLMGLSQRKRIVNEPDKYSYAEVSEMLVQLHNDSALSVDNKSPVDELYLHISDPIISALTKKAITLSITDNDSCQSWKESKLSLFNDKSILSGFLWIIDDVRFKVFGCDSVVD